MSTADTFCTNGKSRTYTLEDLARHKRLSVQFLTELGINHDGQIFRIPYFDSSGIEVLRTRHRPGLAIKDGNPWWGKDGTGQYAYGLWQLDEAQRAGYLILVEGESDCWALWYHHYPALGIPGADGTGVLQKEHLDSIDKIYIHQEPDTSGQRFVENCQNRLAQLHFSGQVLVFSCPNGIKDPADLLVTDGNAFKSHVEDCLWNAKPVQPPQAKHNGNGNVSRNGTPTHQRSTTEQTTAPEPWQPPIPLTVEHPVPAFPVSALPQPLAGWVQLVAEGLQVPVDLPACLCLAVCGAGLAKRFAVEVRTDWLEPTNIFSVVALPSGERKSATFKVCLGPVYALESQLNVEQMPIIAAAASEHRQLEATLKRIENHIAKEQNADQRLVMQQEANKVAEELALHRVPMPPQLVCDDESPENLSRRLHQQGGRMLQASPEATLFEIVKGRYSESVNLEVYLKGHAGDPIRVGRISREGEMVDNPALSCAISVQPHVIQGLAEEATFKGRGFLARWLYSLPESRVGIRQARPKPIPTDAKEIWQDLVFALWGRTVPEEPQILRFSTEADKLMEHFQNWLEPQLAKGEELSFLAGWGNKLPGLIARLAGSLHMVRYIYNGQGRQHEIEAEIVEQAIVLGRNYFLPHAVAAFGLMGADEILGDAQRVAKWLEKQFVNSVNSVNGDNVFEITQRDIHANVLGGRYTAEQAERVVAKLVQYNYMRPVETKRKSVVGRSPSQRYEVNPFLKENAGEMAGSGSHNSQNSRNGKSGK